MALVAALVMVAACSGDDDPESATSADAGSRSETSVRSDGSAPETDEAAAGGWRKVLAPASCKCSDGSPFHYWVRNGDPGKVFFYLEGGGACFSAATCASDTATYTVNLAGDGG
ncbi:MAG: hypothetical protein GX596_14430, partial [Propionibacterium sp.]|nr:hypothetical protein [Propionibacterium sp.]